VVARADGARVYVVNHQSATVQAIDTATDAVVATAQVGEHPWGASLSADGNSLYVSHLLLHPGVTTLDAALSTSAFTPLAPEPATAGEFQLPNGEVRGAYAVAPEPGNGRLWVPHLLLATGTPQPTLAFDTTVFPTLTLLPPGGAAPKRLLFRPASALTFPGSFTDSVSGPRDVAFTPDGLFALVVMAQSEDVMVFDASTGFEVSLVRPLHSALPEGIAVDAAGAHAYVQGRSSHDVTVLSIRSGGRVEVDGAAIDCLQADPMPANLRLGLRLFYSANSAQHPLTQDFWVACSSCHLEGQSDAVTWRFKQGPRDTPSNAGGPINTGFLFRQAVRNDVIQYDETIRVEQGGNYHRTNAAQLPDLQAIADYTNYAIPLPRNPYLAASGVLTPAQEAGRVLFAARCASCHTGAWYTDSGAGNPSLDLLGPVLLHDVETCVTAGSFPDQPALDVLGGARAACQFDTPTLRGVFASAPYFHDGSAATLDEVVKRLPTGKDLSATDRAALVEYLQTL
jgi:YVTN family beta-propeller protein